MPQWLAGSDQLPVPFLTRIRAAVYQLAGRPLLGKEENQDASTSETTLGRKHMHYDGMGQTLGEANEQYHLPSTP